MTRLGLDIVGERGPAIANPSRDFWERAWSLVTGCEKVSPGCDHCSAATMQSLVGTHAAAGEWNGRIDVNWHQLGALDRAPDGLLWLCVPSADLFHREVPDEFLEAVLAAVERNPRHVVALLTKRAARMAAFLKDRALPPNLWPGVTVEGPEQLYRLDHLRRIDARLRWASLEPLLGPLDLRRHLGRSLHWVTCGPELGVVRRPCDPDWMRDIVAQCRAAGVPFFTKHRLDGTEIREIPTLATFLKDRTAVVG